MRLAIAFLVIAFVAQAIAVVVVWFATITAWRTTNQIRLRMPATCWASTTSSTASTRQAN